MAIGLIAAGTLALELAVMRYMLIAYWHHLYYLVISAALLGFGASGTFLSFCREKIIIHAEQACWLFALFFALSTIASFQLLSMIPLNIMYLAWNLNQAGFLLLQYLLLFIPFFWAACCLGSACTIWTTKIGLIYGANMIGSGFGAIIGVGLMYILPAHWMAVFIGLGLFFAVYLFADTRRQYAINTGILLIMLLVFMVLYPPAQSLSEYKILSYYRQLPQSTTLATRHSPLGRIDLIASPNIHRVPGRSLNSTSTVPPQTALILDGDIAGCLTQFEDCSQWTCFDETTFALPYHLLPQPRTLILGAGGGTDIGLALYHQSKDIIALELNEQVIDLVSRDFAANAGYIYTREGVQVIHSEARAFLRQTEEQFDLIQIPPMDTLAATAAGVHALNEDYLLTVNAVQLYLDHLTPGGVLCMTRWLRYWPERDGVKLIATAIEALESKGMFQTNNHLLIIRSWATITVLTSPTPFSDSQISSLKNFCYKRQFDMVYYPGITPDETNRFHVLQTVDPSNSRPIDVYYQAAQQLLDRNSRENFYNHHLCQIRPATDDRPYFHDFFRWKSLKSLRRLLGENWIPFMDWGYLILVIALIQSVLVGIICILLPLRWLPHHYMHNTIRLQVLIYFASLGCAYMFLEMAFIQRLALLLADPIAAIAVVLAAFLIFSGLGSFFAPRWFSSPRRGVLFACVGLILIGGLYTLFWNNLVEVLQTQVWLVRCFVSVFLLAPMAFLMGTPFPLGLLYLSKNTPQLVPWAWGVNGFASVTATSLSVCIAMSEGHTLVLMIGLGLYIAVAFLSRTWSKPSSPAEVLDS